MIGMGIIDILSRFLEYKEFLRNVFTRRRAEHDHREIALYSEIIEMIRIK